MLDQAIVFAALAHAGQKRKYTGDPYIIHTLEVMSIVRTVNPNDIEVSAAAVLHDTVEDTGVSPREIKRRFGDRVTKLVEELTEVRVAGNRAKNKAAEVVRLSQVSADAQTIKVADLISNSDTIVKFDPKFAKVYLPEKRALLTVLAEADAHLWWQADEILKREGY